jgi:hypothetical protein
MEVHELFANKVPLMKLLLWDSRSGATYTDLLGESHTGHDLEIDSAWPIVVSTSWNEFRYSLESHCESLCAFMIHTSDAELIRNPAAAPDIAYATSSIALTLKEHGHGDGKPLIFFSGGGVTPEWERSLSEYTGTVRVCHRDEAKQLIHEFSNTGDCSIFDVSNLEMTLQLLSAILPFGFLWEAHENRQTAVSELEKAVVRGVTGFERDLQLYIAASVSSNDREEATQHLLGMRGRWLERISSGNAQSLINRIDNLCLCEDLESWRKELITLRDDLLDSVVDRIEGK